MALNLTTEMQTLRAQWQAAWPDALATWSRFTRLQEPRFCISREQEKQEGLTGSFAMIRLDDHAVVISLKQIQESGLNDFALPILAHEIGHHILCPGDLGDHARTLARMRYALPTKEIHAPMIANLYTDLLINDRLQKQNNLPMDAIYRVLESRKSEVETSQLWTFYLRTYEVLWSLPKGDLAHGTWSDSLEADAVLGARVVRSYAKDWLRGSGRFAALCLTYLMNDDNSAEQNAVKVWLDAAGAMTNGDAIPDGLCEMDDDEIESARHPAFDEQLSGIRNQVVPQENVLSPQDSQGTIGTGTDPQSSTRYRDVGEYIDILRSLGVKLSDHEIAIRYYRERALPHLIRFPVRMKPQASEPSPEGIEAWEAGEPLQQIDWLQTTLNNPFVIPGYTTVQRIYGDSPGSDPQREADDLYLGIDCSGSMPNPQQQLSFPVLAATIMALSALRAGARVMAVLSGDPGPMVSSGDFVRDEHRVLETLTGYLGTGYAFGVHHMAGTFETRDKARPAHIVLVTDADLFHMMDEGKPVDNWTRAHNSLLRAGKGTCALNIDEAQHKERVARLRADGWRVHSVRDWNELMEFARNFSRENYEK